MSIPTNGEKNGSFNPETVHRRVMPTRLVDLNGETVSDIPEYLLCDNQLDFAEKVIADNMCF